MSESHGNKLWYAVKVKGRSEAMVAAHLQGKGFESFLPTYRANRRWSDRIKTLDLPLFPGYVFSRFDVQKRMPILTIPGVSFIVGTGRSPEPIDETEIAAIQVVMKSGAEYGPHPYVRIGQPVQVENGSLYGLTGVVTTVKNKSRLVVSINMLMRSISVEIEQAWVRPIGPVPGTEFSLSAAGKTLHAPAALR